ncbi:unnamed protein product [Musa acuminata subsp. malaccensis]|uniref:(wild Malaysian banana) hypothetical protein n=1 Tax=Musa acuminata subsp. malaccensis TaxID=214687 RepID=A0A804JC28_MUSAM|nr:unnamed protein product [Musa acuminata subsp. malaccensis]
MQNNLKQDVGVHHVYIESRGETLPTQQEEERRMNLTHCLQFPI